MSSSPLRVGASREEELEYYKKQYEQLEIDLADFQASSKELEEQLERDIETAEKNERRLKEQVEGLRFEVEEWKTKHSKSKAESNSAQNALQKEITTMRDTNRSLQLQLRDTEVMNDDYERQARNTESSLEDLESKYNVAIERGVLLEGEVKHGEQERESLRIEAQRLRDELGDLRVENEITLEKLRLADDTIERLRSRKPSPLAVETLRPRSPVSETSGITPLSPTASTPPPKSDSASDAQTPPSPPLSDGPARVKSDVKTPSVARRRTAVPDSSATPRAGATTTRPSARHARGPSLTSTAGTAASDARGNPPLLRSRPSIGQTTSIPRSESLHQIRNLRGRMQKIEERVHSARSKLPAPQNRTPRGSPRVPPRGSPRSVTSPPGDTMPSSVTLRRTIRRPTSSIPSHQSETTSDTGNSDATTNGPKRRESAVKRLSYGIPRPTSSLSEHQRPTSALDRPPSASATRRPASRTSLASSSAGVVRPASRTSGVFSGPASSQLPTRPSSGQAGTYSTPSTTIPSSTSYKATPIKSGTGTVRTHRPSASISELRSYATSNTNNGLQPGESSPSNSSTLRRPTTASNSRRGEDPFSASNTAAAGGRRQSATANGNSFLPSASKTLRLKESRRVLGGSIMFGEEGGGNGGISNTGGGASSGMMPPPPRMSVLEREREKEAAKKRASDVGETY